MDQTPHAINLNWGPLCAFGASVTWAIGSSGYAKLARSYTPFAVNFARAGVGLLCFIAVTPLLEGSIPAAIAAWGSLSVTQLAWLAVSVLASYGLGDVFFMWSARSLGVPTALAIGSTYPVITAGGGALLQGQTLEVGQWLGLLLTVGGVISVIIVSGQVRGRIAARVTDVAGEPGPSILAPDAAELGLPSGRTRGLWLALATSGMWALNSYATSRGGAELSPWVGNSFRMMMAMVMTAAFGRLLAPTARISIPISIIWRWFPLFFVEAFGGSMLFLYGLAHSPLALASTLSSLAPVLSVPVALALRTERFSWPKTAAVCAVVAGVWLLNG